MHGIWIVSLDKSRVLEDLDPLTMTNHERTFLMRVIGVSEELTETTNS